MAVEFEEGRGTISNVSVKRSGMVGWLVNNGVVNNERAANILLLVLLIVILIVAFLFFQYFRSSTTDVIDKGPKTEQLERFLN